MRYATSFTLLLPMIRSYAYAALVYAPFAYSATLRAMMLKSVAMRCAATRSAMPDTPRRRRHAALHVCYAAYAAAILLLADVCHTSRCC